MLGDNTKKLRAIRGRRIQRVRVKISGTAERPRLAVFRSLKHISAQLIDDTSGQTMVAVSDREFKGKTKSIESASEVGKLLAKKAISLGIKAVVFDRRWYKYHGRVKALADAARTNGLEL